MAREPTATHTRAIATPLDVGHDLRGFFGTEPQPRPLTLNALQRARIATGLSQDELAAELGVC
jgi:hypothetical protein